MLKTLVAAATDRANTVCQGLYNKCCNSSVKNISEHGTSILPLKFYSCLIIKAVLVKRLETGM